MALLPVVLVGGAVAALLLGRRSRSSSSSTSPSAPASRTVVASGPAEPAAWSWRVLALPGGGYLGQWRAPHSPGFAPMWIDVPAGAVRPGNGLDDAQAREYARNLALEQIANAQMGIEVVDSGNATGPAGTFTWRVVRTLQGLFEGQVELVTGEWSPVLPQATSPLYARNLALEAIASLTPQE